VNDEQALNTKDYVHSSLRESIIEHLFVGDLLRALWLKNRTQIEVLKPQVDNSGYDLAIECTTGIEESHSILWHIQLKASHAGAKRDSVNVGLKLTQKPNWCVIWIFFDPEKLSLGPFLWFGTEPGKPRPDIAGLKATKHTKGDATGKKKERPGLREVPKTKFGSLKTIDDVIHHLFSERQ
jgi:hypothetical protein